MRPLSVQSMGNICSQKVLNSRNYPTRGFSRNVGVCCGVPGHTHESGNQPVPVSGLQNCHHQNGHRLNFQRHQPSAPNLDPNFESKYKEPAPNRQDPSRTDSGIFRRLGIREGSASVLQPLARQLENENLSPMHHTPPNRNHAGRSPQSPNPPPIKVHRLAQINEDLYREPSSNYLIANRGNYSSYVASQAQVRRSDVNLRRSSTTFGDIESESADDIVDVEIHNDHNNEDRRSEESDCPEHEPLLSNNEVFGERSKIRRPGDPGGTSLRPMDHFLSPAPPFNFYEETSGQNHQGLHNGLQSHLADTGTIRTYLDPSVRCKSDQYYSSSVCNKCGQSLNKPSGTKDIIPEISSASIFQLKQKKFDLMPQRKSHYVEVKAQMASPTKEYVDEQYRLALPEPDPSSTTNVPDSNTTSLPASSMWDHEGMGRPI